MATLMTEEEKLERLETLEDALKLAIEASTKVHIQMIVPHFTGGTMITLSNYLQDGLSKVRDQLNTLYAAEVRRKKGR